MAVAPGIPSDIEYLLLTVAVGHLIDPLRHILHVNVIIVVQIYLALRQRRHLHGLQHLLLQNAQHGAACGHHQQHNGHDPPRGGMSDITAHFHILFPIPFLLYKRSFAHLSIPDRMRRVNLFLAP